MGLWLALLCGLSLPAAAQPFFAPEVTPEGIIPFGTTQARPLRPGGIATIYGRHLGPSTPCHQPSETCGVTVTIDGKQAELLYAGLDQINFRVPSGAPSDGSAPLQVCVRGKCSQPVAVRLQTHRAVLRIAGRPRVHMPVWLEAELPVPQEIRYPFHPFPLNTGLWRLEVRHNGRPLPQRQMQTPVGGVIGLFGGSVAPPDAPQGRLPLHVLYGFDRPGRYEVRLMSDPLFRLPLQSDWLTFTVLPTNSRARERWLARQAAQLPLATPGQLVGDLLPALLARLDARSLRLLLPLAQHKDALVRSFVRYSVALYPRAVLDQVPGAAEVMAMGGVA